jgi:hypothetical protein
MCPSKNLHTVRSNKYIINKKTNFSCHTAAVHYCSAWYLALLQYRGARWFKNLVQLPGDERRTKRHHMLECTKVASRTCDLIQGTLAPVISLVAWVLLITEYLPRSWFYVGFVCLNLCCGLRSFGAIVTKRIATLRRIAALQTQAPGTIGDKRRRRAILGGKAMGIAVDVTTVFTMSCLVNLVLLSSGNDA